MSVFGSIFTAVSGLVAQSQSIGMISNNIANVGTSGYKRTDAAFSSLVTNTSRSTLYSPGSVRALQNNRIDQQGLLQQSNSGTDIAISGNGFFVVNRDTAGSDEAFYTRAGSFSEDKNGVLQNRTSGYYLMGWALDNNGNLPASQSDISSLSTVNVGIVGGTTQQTTEASMALNLDATETQAAYPIPGGTASNFNRDIRVYDALGSAHDMRVSFTKHATPTTNLLGTADLSGFVGPLSANGFAATDDFDVTVGAIGPTTITLNGDVTQLLADLNAIVDGNGDPVLFANLDSNGLLNIKARNIGDDILLNDGSGSPLTGGLGMTASVGLNNAPAGPTILAPLADVANTEGWWDITFLDPNGGTLLQGSINFNGDGSLNATPDVNDQVLLDLTGINWGNGSDLQDITFDIADFSQFSGEYNVVSTDQNGAALGLRTGISIDDDGYVTAQFSNGQSKRLYKLALATFANTNGLEQISGNAYKVTDDSGDFNLREAGQGSAGLIQSGTLEGSNVDMADEFSKMIITQRAYSANTKVITTADQMTQELLQLR